jgi:3-hydroxybutyrate dehydrogenase
VFGPFRINQAFLPMLLESKGRTPTIGSISGFIPSDSDGGYTASNEAMKDPLEVAQAWPLKFFIKQVSF